MKYSGKIEIRETSKDDLENVMKLWNNGDVMNFVGFPNGIGITMEKLGKWLTWVINKPSRCHYSIYAEGIGYCGETFYDVNSEHGLASLDIKLLPVAQGKGIAKTALVFSIDKAFDEGCAERVYVDPHPDNRKAWTLYEKLGFVSKPRPEYLEKGEVFLEINKSEWEKQKGQ